MFDLFRSRDKAVRYLLGALLGLVALSMVITLVPGYGSGGYGQEEQVLAKIGDEQVTAREVQLALSNEMRRRTIPPAMIEHYVPMFVTQMITERAVAYQAKRMGFRVTDAELAATIQSIVPQLFPNGQYLGDEYLRQFLSEMNQTIDQFEANVRKQMLLTKLRNLTMEGIIVTPAEIEGEYRRRNEKGRVRYAVLSPGKLRQEVKPTDAEIQTYFAANRPQFQIPEKRSFQVVLVDEAKVAAALPTSDDELRKLYDANRDRFRTQERVKARHILVKTVGKSADEKIKLKAKAQDLLKQIKGGADFGALAKQHSEDPGSAINNGELDWYTRGQAVKAFDNALFTLKKGELSDLVETEYGYHIVQVLQKEDAKLRPFDEVKAELASESRKQLVYDKMQQLADQAQGAATKNPQQVLQIAQQMGLTVATADKVGTGEPVPEVGVSPELQGAVFGAEKGKVTPVVQVGPTRLAFAVVTDVQPARPAELTEVASQVRERVVDQKARELLTQRSKELEAKLKAANNDLDKVAKEMGLEVKTSEPFGRDATVPGLGPATYFTEAFNKPTGSIIGPVNTGEHVVIAAVAEKQPADMAKLGETREMILSAVKSKKARERQDLFEDGVLKTLEKEGKVKVNEGAIQRLVAGYRA